MTSRRKLILFSAIMALAAGVSVAQMFGGGGFGGRGGFGGFGGRGRGGRGGFGFGGGYQGMGSQDEPLISTEGGLRSK